MAEFSGCLLSPHAGELQEGAPPPTLLPQNKSQLDPAEPVLRETSSSLIPYTV